VVGGACMMQIIKIREKGQFTIPGQFQKKSNIKEVSGLFEKETLDSRELKMFAQTSRVISKV
jgi:bifunctional DNA-binding transcriptional regulator/antitoxin component of YhaV-PrlF toxin-antitoxin module